MKVLWGCPFSQSECKFPESIPFSISVKVPWDCRFLQSKSMSYEAVLLFNQSESHMKLPYLLKRTSMRLAFFLIRVNVSWGCPFFNQCESPMRLSLFTISVKVSWESLFQIFKQSESSSKRALKSHITVSCFITSECPCDCPFFCYSESSMMLTCF